MKEETVQGIILQSIPYQDSHRIITLYTYEAGLLKLFASWGGKLHFMRPLNKLEILYKKGKGDLDNYVEGRLIKSFSEGNLAQLTAASEMAKTLLYAQEVGKVTPKLYMLFEAFLTAMPYTKNPQSLLLSFHLKHMLHEGFFSLNKECAECSAPLKEAFYYTGEPYCQKHAEENSLHLSSEELNLIVKLGMSRSISELDDLEPSKVLTMKIQSFINAKGGT